MAIATMQLMYVVSFMQVNAQTAVQMIFRDASYVLKETLGCDMEQLENGKDNNLILIYMAMVWL